MPTKIIHGALDPVIIKPYLAGVESCFEDVEIAYLEGGHFILDEQPQAVAEQMDAFLSEQ